MGREWYLQAQRERHRAAWKEAQMKMLVVGIWVGRGWRFKRGKPVRTWQIVGHG